ncbi:GNAT family N-acetyltransferase [Actinoplanes sichuanensis]|uniref:GNAT family N-acetyltransferase n=1 Tax=Actinoplanes sichuanensis TaxID=512349 RepID=A0ABW4AT63_9ACTN|nr:GNAT family N-acetyltransferase [Actinoplanes sichuanensis]
MKLSTFRDIREIGIDDWASVSGQGSAFSGYHWLAYVQTHRDAEASYLVAQQRRTTIAALPTYFFADEVPRYYDPHWLLRDQWQGKRRPVLLGGCREGYLTDILANDATPDDERSAAVSAIVEEIRRRRAEVDAVAAILYLPDTAMERLGSALKPTDRRFVVDAEAIVTVPDGGLRSHVDSLPRKRRASVRHDMERFARSGCRLEVATLTDCYQKIGRLSAALLDRYGRVVDPVEEVERFRRQAENTVGMNRVFCAYLGDEMVGFAHFVRSRDVLYARSVGFDYTVAREAALYFNLTYYAAIDFAAENGVRSINYGCDSFQTKVFKGAKLHPLWAVVLDADQSGFDRIDYAVAEQRVLGPIRDLDESVITETVKEWSPGTWT